MGVTPIEAGFSKVRIEPRTGSLKYARMKLPTIRGTIAMDIESSGSGSAITVTIPANMTAEICLPDGDVRQTGPGTHSFTY